MSKLHSLLAFNIDKIHQTYSTCGINIIDLTIDTGEKSLSRGVWILKVSTRLRVWQARQVMSRGIWHSCLYRFDTWSL